MRQILYTLLCLAFLLVPAACGGGGGGGDGDLTTTPETTDPGDDPPPGDTPPPDDPPPADDPQMSAAELAFAMEVLDLVNQERTDQGLGTLTWDDDLTTVAYLHSVDMDVRDFWDNGYPHVDPDGNGLVDRLDAAGITYSLAGENIAIGYTTPEAVMDGWMNSPGHKANILNAGFTQLGIGLHVGDWPHNYWTQVFLKPR